MIAVQRWGAEEGLGDELICDEGKDVRSSSNFRPVPHGYSMIYWREGMGVVYDGGYLLVESYTEKVSRNSLRFSWDHGRRNHGGSGSLSPPNF